MLVVTLDEALNILGYDILYEYINYMCKETYNMWFDKYYSKYLDIYPTYESLIEVYINLANNIKTNNYYQGYLLLNNEDIGEDLNKIIGYVSVNYNDFTIYNDDRDKDTLWLTDLFIWPEYRSKGYSNILINYVKEIGKELNKDIYIACEDKLINFYLNKNWIFIKLLDNIWNIMILKF